jgi:hypothetical protein
VAVGLYSLGAGAFAALGRHGFGIAYAVESSRYILSSAFLPLACVALGALLTGSLSERLPAGVHRYSWALAGTVTLVAAAGTLRVLEHGRTLVVMEGVRTSVLAGKVAVLGANLVELEEYRRIYPHGNYADFKLSANFLNRKGWLRPPLWDENFLKELDSRPRREEPEFGRIETFARSGDKLRIAGYAAPGYAIIVHGKGRGILAVLFPVGGLWAGEIPLTDAAPPRIRCLAYDAAAGQVHLLARGDRL